MIGPKTGSSSLALMRLCRRIITSFECFRAKRGYRLAIGVHIYRGNEPNHVVNCDDSWRSQFRIKQVIRSVVCVNAPVTYPFSQFRLIAIERRFWL
jgi:hypothetical protein